MTSGNLLDRMQLELRRLEAARELENGARQAHLVWKYQISRTTAMRWHRATREGGVAALRRRLPRGRPSLLSADQQQRLRERFLKGPRACGFDGDTWCTRWLKAFIAREFGVNYQSDYVRRLRNKLQSARF